MTRAVVSIRTHTGRQADRQEEDRQTDRPTLTAHAIVLFGLTRPGDDTWSEVEVRPLLL